MEQGNKTVKLVVSVSSVILMVVFVSLVINSVLDSAGASCEDTTSSKVEAVLMESSTTLSPIGSEISSSSVKANNDTWLEFDGINDFMTLNSTSVTSISFWYKNDTTWYNVVNVSGTLYVDGSVATPDLYPIYNDGSDFYFGKTDATTFVKVSVDEIRTFSNELSTEQITAIYNGGRF